MTYSQTRERPQPEWIPHSYNAKHHWEPHGTHCCQETRQRPQAQGDTPCKSQKGRWENAAAFAYEVYEGFQKKKQTMAVAFNLDYTYNRVQFKLLMNLFMQYGINLTLTQWTAVVLLERTVAMQLGNWSSVPHQLTMGLPQGSPLLPVLFNVYTKDLADLNQNGPSKILRLADDELIYKTSRDSQGAAKAVQHQLDSEFLWCHDNGSVINPNKAQTLWCTLDNRAAGKPMPVVTFDGAVVKQTSHMSYLGVHFDRMLIYRKHLETTALKCKVCQSWRLWLCHLFLLYQSVVLSVTKD